MKVMLIAVPNFFVKSIIIESSARKAAGFFCFNKNNLS